MTVNDPHAGAAFSGKRTLIGKVDLTAVYGNASLPRKFTSEIFEQISPLKPSTFVGRDYWEKGDRIFTSVSVDPTDVPFKDPGTSNEYFEISQQFYNNTNRVIRVTNRQNITISLDKCKYFNAHHVENFVIRRIYKFYSIESIRSVINNSLNDSQLSCSENVEKDILITKLKQAIKDSTYHTPVKYIEVVIDRLLPIELFKEYLSIYVHDIDVLFRQGEGDKGISHPFSIDAIANGLVAKAIDNYKVSGVLYGIIDNEGVYPNRYVCIGNEVVPVPICRDSTRLNGIYITKIDNVSFDGIKVSMTRHPLEKATDLGLFRTQEEAETNGKLNESMKKDIAMLEQATAKLKAESGREQAQRAMDEMAAKHAIDLEKLKLEAEVRRLAQEAAQAELLNKIKQMERQEKINKENEERDKRQEERREYYENRSHQRKDTSEALKWIPIILAAATAIINTAIALSGNSAANAAAATAAKKFFV